MTNEEITERLNRIQDYEAALMKIEMFGHTQGPGHGYTCANIAEEALRKHLWKPEAVSEQANISQEDADRVVKEYLDLNAFSGFIPIDLDALVETIWESTVDDGLYECKVKRIAEREGILTVLNVTTQKTLLRTPVELAYGASFGPDVHDVAYWQELCINAIDGKE
jgi:hypothetical protein